MTTPEISDSTPARPKHLNTDDAEEKDLKSNSIKMMETFKEEIKDSLKEMEENTNRKPEEIHKFLNENLENQEKTIKQVKETVQDLK